MGGHIGKKKSFINAKVDSILLFLYVRYLLVQQSFKLLCIRVTISTDLISPAGFSHFSVGVISGEIWSYSTYGRFYLD